MRRRTSMQRIALAAAGLAACAGATVIGPSLVGAQTEIVTGTPALAQPERLAPATEDDLRYARSLSRAFHSAAERVEPSVVHITTQSERIGRDFFGRQFRQQASGLGSGVIVSDDGYILTNNHVVAGATRLAVKLYDGRTVSAEVVGGDELRDLAVIKIEAAGLKAAEFGDSDALEVGEWVLAVGSPFGFDQTVTAGIVSAKGRGLGIISDEFKDAEQFIQTDAAINRGNSGGPLINLDGEVVGINSAIFSPSGGSVGLGFSIPERLAQAVYANIRGGGRTDFGYLGVRLSGDEEVTVEQVVEGSPAALAGLRAGDRILRFQGRSVDDVNQLWRSIQFSPPGSEATMIVERDGKPIEMQAKLGSLTEAELQTFGGREIRSLGLAVITATEQVLDLGAGTEGQGVYVVQVDPGSLAAQAGLVRGDLIVAVDRRRVGTVEEFVSALSQAGARVRIDLRRGEMQGYTTLSR